MTDNEDKNLDF